MSSVISAATLTTSPTTTIAGGRTPSSATRLSTCSSVELIVRCVGRVPSAITETGVSGLRPYRNSSSATAPIRFTAISSTSVPELPPSSSQFTVDRLSPGATCTDTTWNSCVTPRWVSGTQALAGTPTALVAPGTTGTGTPARRQARTEAGVQAADAPASSARTYQVRWASAAAATAALTSWSSVHAQTSQAPAQSPAR